MTLTFDDYAKQILHPMVLRHIASGMMDHVLDDEILIYYWNDPEMFTAIIERMKILAIKENDQSSSSFF